MRILIAAGGTGGHINPAISLAEEIRSRDKDASILFVGTKNKMEATLVPKAGFDFTSISISGFQRSFAPSDIIHNLCTLYRLMFVTRQCKKIIEDFKPDVAVGFGGYVSGPVIRTAHMLGIKTAIHEQNAFPGKTNIALSKYADAVMLTSDKAEKYLKCKIPPVVTGLPVREDILCADKKTSREKLSVPQNAIMVLSTGGSLGAEAINKVMCEVIPGFADKGIIFVHGYGENGKWFPEKLAENGTDIKNYPNLRISEFIFDMADNLAAADLVISRAGASSLAEIQVSGKASVLIPSPYVSENHQYYNAMALADNNAAIVTEQSKLTADGIAAIISELITAPEKYESIGKNARNMAKCDAKKKICDIVLSLT